MIAPQLIDTFLGHVFSGAMDEAMELVTDDATFVSTRADAHFSNPLHGTFLGRDGARAFFAGFSQLLVPGDFKVQGKFGDSEHSAHYGTLLHHARTTGKPFASDWALICKLRGGKIASYHFYEDSEALALAIQ